MPILHLYSNMRNISRISISIIIFDQCLGKIDIKLMSMYVIIKENVGIGSLTFGQINWNIGNFNIYDTKCHINIFIIFWLNIVFFIRTVYQKEMAFVICTNLLIVFMYKIIIFISFLSHILINKFSFLRSQWDIVIWNYTKE